MESKQGPKERKLTEKVILIEEGKDRNKKQYKTTAIHMLIYTSYKNTCCPNLYSEL